ncbi:hypothetical protein ACWFRC_10520 [Bacillus cereus]
MSLCSLIQLNSKAEKGAHTAPFSAFEALISLTWKASHWTNN